MRFSEPSQTQQHDHRYAVGRGGHRIDSSKNLWDTSRVKIDGACTDVAWAHGGAPAFHSPLESGLMLETAFSNKILTSSRNGDLIMWDLNKSGSTKYGQ